MATSILISDGCVEQLLQTELEKIGSYQEFLRLLLYLEMALERAEGEQAVKLQEKLREAQKQFECRRRDLCQSGRGCINYNHASTDANRKKEDAMSDKGEDGVGTAKRFCEDCYGSVLPGEKECFKCGSANIQLAPVIEEQAEITPCRDICTENPPALYGNFGCPLPART